MAQFSKERVKWVGFSDLDISGNLSYSGLYGVHNNGAGGAFLSNSQVAIFSWPGRRVPLLH